MSDCFNPDNNDCVNCWNGFPHDCKELSIEEKFLKIKEIVLNDKVSIFKLKDKLIEIIGD